MHISDDVEDVKSLLEEAKAIGMGETIASHLSPTLEKQMETYKKMAFKKIKYENVRHSYFHKTNILRKTYRRLSNLQLKLKKETTPLHSTFSSLSRAVKETNSRRSSMIYTRRILKRTSMRSSTISRKKPKMQKLTLGRKGSLCWRLLPNSKALWNLSKKELTRRL